MFRRRYDDTQTNSETFLVPVVIALFFALVLAIHMWHYETAQPQDQQQEALPIAITPVEDVSAGSVQAVLFEELPKYTQQEHHAEFISVWGPDNVADMAFIAAFTQQSRIVLKPAAKRVVQDEVMPRVKQQVYLAWVAAGCPTDEYDAMKVCTEATRTHVIPHAHEVAALLLSVNK